MDYDKARKLLEHAGTGRELERKKVANNTYARRLEDGSVAIKLHATDIITFHPDNYATVSAGGWLTVTTKARINDYAAPYGVSSSRGVWTVSAILEPGHWDTADRIYAPGAEYIGPERSSVAIPFFEGMRLNMTDPRAGMLELERAPEVLEARALVLEDAETKKKIGRFVRGLTREGIAHAVNSAAGDCFMCRGMFGADVDTEHLESHMAECYYPAHMLHAALEEVGYREPGFILSMESRDSSSAPTSTRRALRRYLEARLLVGPSGGRRGDARLVDADGYYGSRRI